MTHIVAWNFKPELTTEEKNVAFGKIRAALEHLVGEIDGLVSLKVFPMSMPTSSRDLALFSSFSSFEALNAYITHPSHRAAAEIVAKYCIDRICFDHSGGGFYA